MKSRFTLIIILALFTTVAFSQTNPSPYPLSVSDYSFKGFQDAESTTYPASMAGWGDKNYVVCLQADTPSRTLQATTDMPLDVNGTPADPITDIKNQTSNGIGIRASSTEGKPYPIAIVLSISTKGVTNDSVSWTGKNTFNSLGGLSGIQLQYRIGHTGNWINIDGHRYSTSADQGTSTPFKSPVTALPVATEDKDEVQLRWLYYLEDDNAFAIGDRMAVNNISVKAKRSGPTPQPISNFGYALQDTFIVNFIDSSKNTTSWFWTFGDGDSSELSSPMHTFAKAGTYHVCLIAKNPAGADTLCKDLTLGSDTTIAQGINKRALDLLKIYPNPATNMIHVKFPVNGKVQVQIINMLGQTVRKVMMENGEAQFDVSGLPNSIYQVNLISDKYSVTKNIEVLH